MFRGVLCIYNERGGGDMQTYLLHLPYLVAYMYIMVWYIMVWYGMGTYGMDMYKGIYMVWVYMVWYGMGGGMMVYGYGMWHRVCGVLGGGGGFRDGGGWCSELGASEFGEGVWWWWCDYAKPVLYYVSMHVIYIHRYSL